jgi:hypothetical protein
MTKCCDLQCSVAFLVRPETIFQLIGSRGQFGRHVIRLSSANTAANTLLLLLKNYKSLVVSQSKNIFCYLWNALAFIVFLKKSVSSLLSGSYRLTRLPNWGPFLTSPLGVNLAPRGEICPLGVKFTPSFTPRGKHSLLFRRIEGRTENFTPKG